jgi:hypothetical protein
MFWVLCFAAIFMYGLDSVEVVSFVGYCRKRLGVMAIKMEQVKLMQKKGFSAPCRAKKMMNSAFGTVHRAAIILQNEILQRGCLTRDVAWLRQK